MTDSMTAILGIAAAITIGAISPGPSFVMVARTSVAGSRIDGLAAALGMGVGGVIFSSAALVGLLSLLAAVPVLYVALKVLGGTYLVYLGYRVFRGAKEPLDIEVGAAGARPAAPRRSFVLGLATQLSNPKTAIFYASVFSALHPERWSWAALLVLPAVIFAIEAGWYSIVATALSGAGARSRYQSLKRWIDRSAGLVIAAFGGRLILYAR
jgi:threonine/homoserine/homoserine lactone efflux protein